MTKTSLVFNVYHCVVVFFSFSVFKIKQQTHTHSLKHTHQHQTIQQRNETNAKWKLKIDHFSGFQGNPLATLTLRLIYILLRSKHWISKLNTNYNSEMRLITWCDVFVVCSLEMGSIVDKEYDLRDRLRYLLVKFDNDDKDAENGTRFLFVAGCSSCADWFALRFIELPMKPTNDVYTYRHSVKITTGILSFPLNSWMA